MEAIMSRRPLPLARVYAVLEPGPVVLLTTSRKGKPNVMPMSWTMMLDFEPPRIACVVSENNFSFAALKATRECVLNIPTVELLDAVVGTGNISGGKVDKFQKFHLTPVPGEVVAAPLIDECFAALECRVTDTRMVNRYNVFVLECVRAWVDKARKPPRTIHHRGDGLFMVAGEEIRTASKKK